MFFKPDLLSVSLSRSKNTVCDNVPAKPLSSFAGHFDAGSDGVCLGPSEITLFTARTVLRERRTRYNPLGI